MLRPLLPEHPGVDLHIVVGAPFLYVKSSSTLIMSDLHLGFEEAASRGLFYSARKTKSSYAAIFLPKIQLKKALQLFDYAAENLEVKRVVVNGDLKHAFDRLLRQEREEVVEFVKHLKERGVSEVVVVRGNHDNFVKPLLRKLEVSFVSGFSTRAGDKQVLFIHGHEEVDFSEYDVVVIGHEHPSIRCFDVYRFPCLLKIPLVQGKVLVVMPATGPYHPGIVVTPNPADYLSPIIKKLDSLSDMSIITWIDLGEVRTGSTEYNIEIASASAAELVRLDKFTIGNREIATLEFKDFETASLICMA